MDQPSTGAFFWRAHSLMCSLSESSSTSDSELDTAPSTPPDSPAVVVLDDHEPAADAEPATEPEPVVARDGFLWPTGQDFAEGKGKKQSHLFLKHQGGTLMLRRYTRESIADIGSPKARKRFGRLDFRQAWCVDCKSAVAGNSAESLSNFLTHKVRQKCQTSSTVSSKQLKLDAVFDNRDHVAKDCHCSSWTKADAILADKLAALFICSSCAPVMQVEDPFLRALFGFSFLSVATTTICLIGPRCAS